MKYSSRFFNNDSLNWLDLTVENTLASELNLLCFFLFSYINLSVFYIQLSPATEVVAKRTFLFTGFAT